MSSTKIYHYTSFSKIGGILGKFPGELSGLIPQTRIGFNHNDSPRAIFGLLDPLPQSWIHNSMFPVTWPTLIHDFHVDGTGVILVEAIVQSTDAVFVGDRGHLEGFLYTDKGGILDNYLHETAHDAHQAFIKSIMPLNEYLYNQTETPGYALPEVIIFSPIPKEAIHVSTIQPFIEEDLATKYSRNQTIHFILYGYATNELIGWKKQFEARHGSLERE